MIIRTHRIEAPRPDNGLPKEERKPKKKVAVLIGYCGTGYHGMQINPPNKTIEGDLYAAFGRAGAVSADNAADPKKSGFMRAARTDKGVHAAGNVVSLKLITEDPKIKEKINEELPETIRVWGISRTNKSFECRKVCDSRIYEYLIPSYAFLPPKPTTSLAKAIEEAKKEFPGHTREDEEGKIWWENVKQKLLNEGISEEDTLTAMKQIDLEEYQRSTSHTEEEIVQSSSSDVEKTKLLEIVKRMKIIENQERRQYRISQERLELVRKALKLYEGGHNFHNFTIGKAYKDPSAQRFMKSLVASEPKIIEGTEWISIKIHGQSFMLHQIRKMISMVALVVRTGCPLERITEAFKASKINIPKAPSLGLLLQNPIYEGYNKKLESFGHPQLTFEPYEKEMEDFKMKYIYDKIYSEEAKENVFHGFFAFIDSFNGDPIFEFLTARGIIENKGSKQVELKIGNDDDDDEAGSDREGY